MAVVSEELAQRAMELAARLRAVQAATADQPADTRQMLIDRELDEVGAGMSDEAARAVFALALEEFAATGTEEPVLEGAARPNSGTVVGALGGGGKDDAIALAGRLAKAWSGLSEAERADVVATLGPLLTPGAFGQSERDAVVGPMISEIKKVTGQELNPEELIPARVGDLAAELFQLTHLSRTLWDQWEEILSDLRRPRNAPTIAALAPEYLKARSSGDAVCRDMAKELGWVSKVLSYMVQGTKTQVREFAKDHMAEFAPAMIERAVGGGWNAESKAWARYKEMMANVSKETISEDVLDRIRRRCTGK